MQATDLPGMWTVSINESAHSAAAAVAFFNGKVDDPSVIGVDRYGKDWGTVGFWAQLRSDRGNPDPVDIHLWEVGNEVFGARPETGGARLSGVRLGGGLDLRRPRIRSRGTQTTTAIWRSDRR